MQSPGKKYASPPTIPFEESEKKDYLAASYSSGEYSFKKQQQREAAFGSSASLVPHPSPAPQIQGAGKETVLNEKLQLIDEKIKKFKQENTSFHRPEKTVAINRPPQIQSRLQSVFPDLLQRPLSTEPAELSSNIQTSLTSPLQNLDTSNSQTHFDHYEIPNSASLYYTNRIPSTSERVAKNTDHDEEKDRLKSIVEVQKKMIQNMQNQLREEREKNLQKDKELKRKDLELSEAHNQSGYLKSLQSSGMMRKEQYEPLQADQSYHSLRSKNTEWEKMKQDLRAPESFRSSVKGFGVSACSGRQESSPPSDKESHQKMPPKGDSFRSRRRKSKLKTTGSSSKKEGESIRQERRSSKSNASRASIGKKTEKLKKASKTNISMISSKERRTNSKAVKKPVTQASKSSKLSSNEAIMNKLADAIVNILEKKKKHV